MLEHVVDLESALAVASEGFKLGVDDETIAGRLKNG